MAERALNTWKDRFARDIGIKDSVILYGNVFDICKNTLDGNRYNSFLENVVSLVRAGGYKKIHVWDSVDGENTDLGDRIGNVSASDSASRSGNSYLDDNDDSFIAPATGNGSAAIDVDNFFSQMLNALRSSVTPTAFILDYSDYIFGNSNNLGENDRRYLVKISKTLQSQRYNVQGSYFEDKGNLVVIITKNQASIPPIYYLNNPQVSSINIPYPGRLERVDFVDSTISGVLHVSNSLTTSASKIEKENFVDLLDGFSLKEIAQLAKLSRQIPDNLSCEKLVNLYKYGEKISPWEELNKDKLENIEDHLKARVKGQDEAVAKVKSVILRAFTGFSGLQHSAKQRKPKGTLFFVGPTGVGKTELAKSIAEFIFGDENACIRFDMSEFSQEHSDQRLIGAPPGYVGYEAGGQLTNAVMAKPFCVLLFDEIEKAHGRILDKFLQILEDGRLTDSKGQTVYFSESIIIFTSNIGASSDKVSPDMDHKMVRNLFMEEVKNHFVNTLKRPELLNRIGDNIVPFNFISDPDVLSQIAQSKVRPLVNFMKERYQATLMFENNDVFDVIVKNSDTRNGGRGLLNVIESKIVNPLADFVFENMEDLQGRTIVISKNVNPNVSRFQIKLV